MSPPGSSVHPERENYGISELPLDLSNSRVYRREVVARRFRSVLVRRSHCVRLMPAVLGFCLASLCLAACGGSEVSTSTTTSPSPATNTIISAWFAAQRAFDAAAINSDAHSPRLAATMISPQLEHVRENLQTFASLGYGARGPTYFGKPKVRDQAANQAHVVSCVHGEEIEIDMKTGKPVPGVLGQSAYELVNSAMRRTASGWKLANQTVVVGGCSGS